VTIEISESIARKVLKVVDAGLSGGLGSPTPGNMCVEAAVCYALGLPHGDDPQCVSHALRSLKIRLNDSSWSSKAARAAGMRRLAVAQLGSKGELNDVEFAKRVATMAIRKSVPIALRAAASIQKESNHKAALLAAVDRCEKEGTRESALNAKRIAAHDDAASYAYDAASYAAYAVDAAEHAAAVASYASYAAEHAAVVASYASYADASYASYAAEHAAVVASYASAADAKKIARDTVLAEFAEDVVQILIEMKAPGCQWLWLTELPKAS
jgi:hypothetical protein